MGHYSLHWMMISVPNLDLLKQCLAEIFNLEVVTFNELSPTFFRLANNVCNEIAVIQIPPNQKWFVQLPGALFEKGIGYNLAKNLVAAYDAKAPMAARLVRFDPKIDKENSLVTDVWPQAYMSAQFLSHPGAWEEQAFGNPPHSFRLVHRDCKIRTYDKIRQIQSLVIKKKATAEHMEFLSEHHGVDVTRFELELRGRFAEFGNALLRQNLNEQEFSDQTVSYFIKNNPMKEHSEGRGGKVLKKKKICSFWEALDPLGGKYQRISKIPRNETKKREFDDLARTGAMLRGKFLKWGYTERQALGYLLNIFFLNNNEWLWDDEVPSYEELLEAHINAVRAARERPEG